MKILLSTISLLLALSASAQEIRFDQQRKQFGKINEASGVVNHRFTFESSASQEIDSVGSTCGCTATRWSPGVITAGTTGYVEVQFDPHNRPGPFDKSVTVKFKSSDQLYYLNVSGFVVPKPGSIQEEFPWSSGHLRLKNRFLNLGNIPNRGLASKSFEVYNQGDQILVFSDEMEGPDHITITFEPYTLKPHSRGKMWVHYDVATLGTLGYFREDVSIFTYESQQPRKDLVTSVTVLDIPAVSQTNAPRIQISPRTRDFGIKQQGDSVRVAYSITNSGPKELLINRAFSSCNCVQLHWSSKKIAPGSSVDLEVLFLTDQRLGNQHKNITIFSNDPRQPVTVLTLKGLLRGPRD